MVRGSLFSSGVHMARPRGVELGDHRIRSSTALGWSVCLVLRCYDWPPCVVAVRGRLT
jgi:hypothetical protein